MMGVEIGQVRALGKSPQTVKPAWPDPKYPGHPRI